MRQSRPFDPSLIVTKLLRACGQSMMLRVRTILLLLALRGSLFHDRAACTDQELSQHHKLGHMISDLERRIESVEHYLNSEAEEAEENSLSPLQQAGKSQPLQPVVSPHRISQKRQPSPFNKELGSDDQEGAAVKGGFEMGTGDNNATFRGGVVQGFFPGLTDEKAIQILESTPALIDTLETMRRDLADMPGPDDETPDPPGLSISLMRHQRQALRWMQWRESCFPYSGILADDMGLGKTVTIIALILHAKAHHRHEEEYSQNPVDSQNAPTLIVAPAAVVTQWEAEIRNRCKGGWINLNVFHGKSRVRDLSLLASSDIVLTSYETLQRDSSRILYQLEWERLVLDEAHQIKNFDAERTSSVCAISSRRRWGVTGTPLQNRVSELFSLFQFLRFEPFDDLGLWEKCFTSSPCVISTLLRFVMLRRLKSDKDRKTGEMLVPIPSKKIHIHYLRLSAEEQTIHDALRIESLQLYENYKTGQKDEFSARGPAGGFGHRHEQILDGVQQQPLPLQFFGSIVRMRQACCHPALVKHPALQWITSQRASVEASRRSILRDPGSIWEASIANASDLPQSFTKQKPLSQAEEAQVAHEGHAMRFTQKAIDILNKRRPRHDLLELTSHGHLKYHCGYPKCKGYLKCFASHADRRKGIRTGLFRHMRKEFKDIILDINRRRFNQTINSGKRFNHVTSNTYASSKLEACMNVVRLIENRFKDDKIVIVSQWTSLLKIVSLFLERRGRKFFSIDSSINQLTRKRIIEDFNTNPTGINLMLLSMVAGGVGLNLIGANHLILLDLHWNPAIEKQVCDRIHRVGQQKRVHIHKLVTNNTVEETVLHIQNKKNKLFEEIIEVTRNSYRGVNGNMNSGHQENFSLKRKANSMSRNSYPSSGRDDASMMNLDRHSFDKLSEDEIEVIVQGGMAAQF